jgi:hypothetical protein
MVQESPFQKLLEWTVISILYLYLINEVDKFQMKQKKFIVVCVLIPFLHALHYITTFMNHYLTGRQTDRHDDSETLFQNKNMWHSLF